MTTSSYESLSHAKWDGKYHVVFIPKGRKKALYGKSRKFLGPVLRERAGQRGSTIVEGHMGQDHVHMLIRIPPKYAVAEVIGSIKGTSAIAVARQCGGRQRNFHGERFWARGYAGSTVGCEEAPMRASIKPQEQLDAEGSDESGEFSQRDRGPWQPLGLLTTVKPPALRGRYDFRDAKQYWGLADCMNTTPTGVTNAANRSLFMVNVAYRLRTDIQPQAPDYSVLDLKADCRGYKYVEETIKMLPAKSEPVLLGQILTKVARLGRIHVSPPAFSFS